MVCIGTRFFLTNDQQSGKSKELDLPVCLDSHDLSQNWAISPEVSHQNENQ